MMNAEWNEIRHRRTTLRPWHRWHA